MSTARMSVGEIKAEMRGSEVAASNPSRNWAELAISVGQVREIQYEDLKCTLLVITGESDYYEYAGVDLTLPGGGRRHFFGAVPERGDLCLVGWAARESSGTASARTPVILGWVAAAPWMGHEWTPFARFSPGEFLNTPKERAVAIGLAERVRFKLRHVGPGNVLCSSSEGSDLVLDDGVLLSSRRGSELVLRDNDSAFIARSVASYAVTSGTRVYSGPVAREARLLPPTVFSDGVWWDAPIPMTSAIGEPVGVGGLPSSPDTAGSLTPGLIFQRSRDSAGAVNSSSRFVSEVGGVIPASLDPFEFLSWGGYVDGSGYRGDADLGTESHLYGGKPLYRVGVTPSAGGLPVTGKVNAVGVGGEALTEYRVEVAHTSDGTLPVTEQTDGFDADRLPSSAVSDASRYSLSPNRAFVEWVLGSVVGNDPFSTAGRPLYGVPLKPVVFGAGGAGLVSGFGSVIGDHAATLLRGASPSGAAPSWSSFTKSGAYRAVVGAGGSAVEVSAVGSVRLDSGAGVQVFGGGGVGIRGEGEGGVSLTSRSSRVVIYGGGVGSGNPALDADNQVSSGGSAPAVSVTGVGPVQVTSSEGVTLAAPRISLRDAALIDLRAQSSVSISSGQQVSLTGLSYSASFTGGSSTVISGPAGFNPANGPSRDLQINATPATGNLGGTVDRYTCTYGDRTEEFTVLGSHSTTVNVGNLTYETRLGRFSALAGSSALELDSVSGLSVTVAVGDASSTVATGAYSVVAQQGVNVTSLVGSATVSGAQGVKLVSPGTVTGVILSGSDTDPLTGLRYELLGLTPRKQTLAFV